jgi:hypothetical protein
MTSTMTTLFAYDGSGSTGGSTIYHTTSQNLFAELPAPPETQILFWDSEYRVISPAQLAAINAAKQGNGGTDPELIARHVVATDFHGHLVLLSDGQVSQSSVAACDRTLPVGWTFASVRVILVNTGGTVNMSVSCPFTRNSPHIIQMVTAATPAPTTLTEVKQEAFSLLTALDSIRTVADWTAAVPTLEPVVIARTMGTTGDPSLRDRLLALKARIQRAEADAKGGSETVPALQGALDTGYIPRALCLADQLTREYYGDDDTHGWSAQLNRLVSMCEGALRGTFDLSNINGVIQSDLARRAPLARPVAATAAEETEPILDLAGPTGAFVCPITLDPTVDIALLVADGTPLLAGLDKDTVTDLTKCPLFLFCYPEVLAHLQTRLDHPLSLRALKEAEAVGASITESPMTRRPILGALCLGPHEDHVAATNWTLARLTAGGKCLGNPDLWFAAIWLLVKRGAIPFLSPILPQLTAHLAWRLRNHKAPLSLVGTPEFPTTRVPLGVALWYAVSSSALSPPPARETVRAHLPYLSPLLEILELTGYAQPAGLPTHLTRLRVALGMLGWSKRGAESQLRATLRALYQAAVQEEETNSWIPLDGPASDGQQAAVLASLPALYRTLSREELVGLGALVGPGKSAADVPLPFDWESPPLPTPVTTWAYGLAPIPRFSVPICPATCRPYYKVPPTKAQTWMDAARDIFHMEPEQYLPVTAEYGHYVVKHGVFPTKTELLKHLWRRVSAQGKTTLPSSVVIMVEDILADFAPIETTLSPAEVGRRFQSSVKRIDREQMERTD